MTLDEQEPESSAAAGRRAASLIEEETCVLPKSSGLFSFCHSGESRNPVMA
jgi:hypothetical protein